MDLVICVGESCHLNGAEIVVRHFKRLLREAGLESDVRLKGSFCVGECSEAKAVTVKVGDRFLHTRYQESVPFFEETVLPLIRETLARG